MGIFAILANIFGLGVQGVVAYSNNRKIDRKLKELSDQGMCLHINGKKMYPDGRVEIVRK